MRRRDKIVGFFVLLVTVLLYWNCTGSGKVDTAQDFAMALNGSKYQVKLSKATAKITEMESGYHESYAYSVMFPTAKFNRLGAQGFELTFDPHSIELEEVMESRAGDENYSLRVNYYPLVGHRMNEGILLQYSSKIKTGKLRVRFDSLVPKIGGRVKGIILEATLYGFFEDQHSMETIEPHQPKKLEIYNFPFDTVFQQSLY